MAEYLAPGIYMEEVTGGSRPIEAVGTSLAGFVGVAPNAKAKLNEAKFLNGWSDFVRTFCLENSKSTALSNAVFGFFQNGGSRCYVVNVGSNGSGVGNSISGGAGSKKIGLDVLAEIDAIAIVAAPGYDDVASWEALLSHCENLGDRVAIIDGPAHVEQLNKLTKVATTGGDDDKKSSAGLRPRQSDKGYGAFYFPHIVVRDALDPTAIVTAAPSGHIAGIYARSDSTRGVHKAPANEALRGALNVSQVVTRADQSELNNNAVNCIRMFPREGIRLWGARTLAPSASEWRYVNVRRLFNMIKESIEESTRWVVFEPNDQALWKAMTRDVRAFLLRLWRSGALMGTTPEQAFFVQCNSETNPQEEIDAGRVIMQIGIAPVKPAEFIIFRIGQHVEGTQSET